MRRTFGLTALLLLAIAIMAIAGCGGNAGTGVGVLKPNAPSGGGGTTSPTVSPTVSPSPAPSVSPFPLGTATVLTSQNNPTRLFFNPLCTDWLMAQGFNLGFNNGAVTRFRADTVNGNSVTDPFSPQNFTFTLNGQAFQLSNPVWIDGGIDPRTGEPFLAITEGFGTANGRVLILKTTQSTPCRYTGAAVATDVTALAPNTPINPVAVDFDGIYLWWTEYAGGAQGKVLRADLRTNPITVVEFMTGLEFPAGIDSNGTFVALAQNGGANYVVAPIEPAALPLTPASPDSHLLLPAQGDPVLLRPFDVAWTQNDTLVTLDGFGFTAAGGPGSAGPGNGNLRFFDGPGANFANTTVEQVLGGLTDPVGLGVIFDGEANATQNRIDVGFVESLNQNGTLRRVGFSSNTPYNAVVSQQLLTSLQRPFHAAAYQPLVSSDAAPVPFPTQFTLFVTDGHDIGQSNGRVVRQTSAF